MSARFMTPALAGIIFAALSVPVWAQSNAPIIYGDLGTATTPSMSPKTSSKPAPRVEMTPENVQNIVTQEQAFPANAYSTDISETGTHSNARANIIAAPSQDFCITVMSEFPQDDGTQESLTPRYQFYKLVQHMAVGATPEFNTSLAHYGDIDVEADTPVMDVIEDIANPVIRQAAPELTVSHMAHLINFAQTCETFVDGQISSLTAFNPSLEDDDLIIQEDALYLRQILSDSLSRLGADTDSRHSFATQSYANSLITARDNIEFASFETELEELEALYMTDLDGRLARSNDMINSEINRETLGDAITLADDMNEQAKRRQKEDQIRTLFRILNGY